MIRKYFLISSDLGWGDFFVGFLRIAYLIYSTCPCVYLYVDIY